MNKDIRNTQYSCHSCNETTQKQHQEPLAMATSPLWPFQKICSDYFEQQGHHYISIVDQFSAWLNTYHFPPTKVTSQTLISTLRVLFIPYGIPEEISSDGGPQFTSKIFGNFLSKWVVQH